MFCEKCGYQNIDGAKFCAGCGEALSMAPVEQTQPVQQPVQQPVDYGYQQQYQPQYQPVNPAYTAAAAPVPQKTAGALVVYIISGILGVIWMLLTLLPQISVPGQSLNTYALIGSLTSLRGTEYQAIGAVLFVILFIVMAMEFVWALLSFLRKRAAGIFGIIAAVLASNASLFWWIIVASAAQQFLGYGKVTAMPALGIVLAIAGLVFSIIELTKKNKV